MAPTAAAALIVCGILSALKWLLPATPSIPTNLDCCFVTAFKDLKRSSWITFNRSTNEYMTRFERLLQLPVPLVIFVEDHLQSKVLEIVARKRRFDLYTQVVCIDEDFLRNHIFAWGCLDQEKSIMRSPEYRDMISHRVVFPENSIAEYTIINHCKVDFVQFVMEVLHKDIDCPIYGWVDFGYFESHVQVPTVMPIADLATNAVTYVAIRQPEESDADRIQVLQNAPDVICGGMFYGNKHVMARFVNLYHEVLREYQASSLADDDQAIVLAAYFKEPTLFHFVAGSWKDAFKSFLTVTEKSSINHG